MPHRIKGIHKHELRHARQSGLVGAGHHVVTCASCFGLAAALYQGWCISCVLKWGHQDDIAEVRRRAHGWSSEAAIAATSPRLNMRTNNIAAQTIGYLDLSTDAKYAIGRLNVERVGNATADDGFLYDDEPRHPGRMSKEAHDYFWLAVTRLQKAGFSIRAIARVTGLSRITIRAWRTSSAAITPCKCGRPATHQGWCVPRFHASKRRQEFMKTWHPSSNWLYKPVDGFRLAWESPTHGSGEPT